MIAEKINKLIIQQKEKWEVGMQEPKAKGCCANNKEKNI